VARRRLASPGTLCASDDLDRALMSHGFDSTTTSWLAPTLLDAVGSNPAAPLAETNDPHFGEFFSRKLGEFLTASGGDRDAAIVAGLALLAKNRLPPDVQPGDEDLARLRRLVSTCRDQGVDFARAAVAARSLVKDTDPLGHLWYLRRLHQCYAVTANELLDTAPVAALGDRSDWWDLRPGSDDPDRETTDLTDARVWVDSMGISSLAHLPRLAASLDDDGFARLARGVAATAGLWLDRQNHFPEYFYEGGPELAQLARHVFEEADRRVGDCKGPSDQLRHVWLRYAWMAVDLSDEWVSPDRRKRLLRAAADEIGRYRPVLRRANDEDAEALTQASPHIRSCMFVLFKLGSLWQATKPLLLAFRATNTRAVGHDLRYWPEGRNDDPREPWATIPRSLMNLLHHYIGHEKDADPSLEAFRTEFARFCLERLKTRDKQTSSISADGLVESDPAWREGFIQAARALRINPGGKGHRVLHWSSQNDPDPEVRELANAAHDQLRHSPSIPKGMSPRRAVFEAFWWLRQAHLISLNEEFDQHGANRTREMEVRRTTESLSN